MWRIEVSEQGQAALPAIDVADDAFAIGSAADARVRLPAEVAQAEHVRVASGRWHAIGDATRVEHGADARATDGHNDGHNDGATEGAIEGAIGSGVTLAIGRYRVRIAPAPPGTTATPPQRTESLARELARSLLGTDGAPTLEMMRGPRTGERRMLAPPESVLVIGRGDEAGWVLVDEDLSRAHAEIRRGWDGTRLVDLGSKNGTRLDGDELPAGGALLRDGATIELGKVQLRFRDPAERHLRAKTAAAPAVSKPALSTSPPTSVRAAAAVAAARRARASTVPFYAALGVMLAAVAGLVWILAAGAT